MAREDIIEPRKCHHSRRLGLSEISTVGRRGRGEGFGRKGEKFAREEVHAGERTNG